MIHKVPMLDILTHYEDWLYEIEIYKGRLNHDNPQTVKAAADMLNYLRYDELQAGLIPEPEIK